MSEHRMQVLQSLGFRDGLNGPHAARTMMLADLRALLAHLPGDATRADYAEAIVNDNVLGKATRVTRLLSLRYLAALYGLDPANPLFRQMRRLWSVHVDGQPLRRRKLRMATLVTPEVLVFALFLGHLEGRSGQGLFSSSWVALLPCSASELDALATSAAHKGELVFMKAGGVVELRFPGALTPDEQALLRG